MSTVPRRFKTYDKRLAAACGLAVALISGAVLINHRHRQSIPVSPAEPPPVKSVTPEPPPANLPLTHGEASLAQSLFGNQIDMSRARKHAGENYSQANDYGVYHSFFAYMAGVWQEQHLGREWIGRHHCGHASGEYRLSDGSRLTDYCAEQQSQIIADFALRFLTPDHIGKNCPTPEDDERLRAIVENQFPQARKTRLARPDRILTREEATLLKSIFAGTIDTSVIVLYFHSKPPSYDPIFTWGETSSSRTIDVFYPRDFSANYNSPETDIEKYGSFVHETVHIRQFQNGDRVPHCDIYMYSLSEGRPFSSYCTEQQADIIQDYARLFLYPGAQHGLAWLALDTPAERALLREVVENQFPQARNTRLVLEAQRHRRKTAHNRLRTVPAPSPAA